MHTQTLTRRTQRYCVPYFRTPDYAPWLCCPRLKNHAELPEGCTKVRLVSVPDEPTTIGENYWDIKQDGTLRGVRSTLTTRFQRWNQSNWGSGDRYVYLEIVK